MKKFFYQLTASLLVLVSLSGFGGAFAAQTAFTDITGHWAESTLVRALNDTLIEGAGDSVDPNGPMTKAEVVQILCGVLSARRTADLSEITDVMSDHPYYSVLSKAVALGLLKPENNQLAPEAPVSRGEAFVMLAEAFQLIPASPDVSVLTRFSDGYSLGSSYRLAAAALVSGGFVQGKNGALNLSDTISRAEFLTVLYKIIPNYVKGLASPAADSGGTVLTGMTTVSNTNLSGPIYYDCASSIIQLQNVTAPAVVIRSDTLIAFSVLSCNIDRLILAQGSGDVTVSPRIADGIGTLVVGSGSGRTTLGYGLTDVEITGSNRDVTITGPVNKLLISGSGNTVTIAAGASAEVIKITGTGSGNTITANGAVGECAVYGPNTVLSGSGTIQKLLDYTKSSTITAQFIDTYSDKDFGLNSVALTLTAPDTVSSYETLKASVSINAPSSSRLCRGTWYLDGKPISQTEVDTGTTAEVSLSSDIRNTGDKPITSTLSFVLSFSDSEGNYQEIKTEKDVILKSPEKIDNQDVLTLVTTGYKGDYTLAWAQKNDYDAAVKTAWVNAKGYASKTEYLVWVSIAYQRVNVFKGSAGKWALDQTFLVGTGATGKDTPTGVFKVIGRSSKGWTTKTYTVKPVILFINYAYGFHSRLYDPGTTTINDARIGYPVSHGCVRMYDEDVAWIYDNIPTNTTVVVY